MRVFVTGGSGFVAMLGLARSDAAPEELVGAPIAPATARRIDRDRGDGGSARRIRSPPVITSGTARFSPAVPTEDDPADATTGGDRALSENAGARVR